MAKEKECLETKWSINSESGEYYRLAETMKKLAQFSIFRHCFIKRDTFEGDIKQ